MKIMIKKQIKRIGLLSMMSALFMISCTNLEIKETDSIHSSGGEGGFSGVEDVDAAISNIYNSFKTNNSGFLILF